MTIEQKTIELQSVSPPLTRDQIIAELGKWQAEQSMQETKGVLVEKKTPEVVENQEPVEEEVVENKEVIEEEGNQEVVADQQDAAVTTTPEDASEEEDTESPSEDGSSESQETEEDGEPFDLQKSMEETNKLLQTFKASINKKSAIQDYLQKQFKDVNSEVNIPGINEEIQGKGGFTYKYTADVDDEGNLDLQVFYKGKDDEEFINATERARNNPNSVTLNNQEASIQSALGFLSEDVASNIYKQRKAREAALKQKQKQQQQPQDFDPVTPGIQSFDDMLIGNMEQNEISSKLESVDRSVNISKINQEAQRREFNSLLEEYGGEDIVEKVKEKKKEYNNKAAEIQKKIDALPMGETGKLAEYQKELNDLKKEYSDVNLYLSLTGKAWVDDKFKELLPEIKTKARELSIIQPTEEPTMLNIVGQVFRGAGAGTRELGPTAGNKAGAAISTLIGDILDPVPENYLQIQEQKDFYNQAKLNYAKRNKVNVASVTNEMVRDDVIDMYQTKLEKDELKRLYTEYAKYEVKVEGGAVSRALLGLFSGSKSWKDVIGETDEEIASKLGSAAAELDLANTYVSMNIAEQNIYNNQLQSSALINQQYLTQEDVDKAKYNLRQLNINTKANLQIIQDNVSELDSKVKTDEEAALFTDVLNRNYGIAAKMVGRTTQGFLNTIIGGVLEASQRYGVTDALLSINPIGRIFQGKKLYDKFVLKKDVKSVGRELTDTALKSIDYLSDTIEGQLSESQTWDQTKTWQDKLAYFAEATGNQVPIMTTLLLSGGAGLPIIGAATSGSKFREMQKEIDFNGANYSLFEMYTAATLTGASAVATEYVTQGMLGRLSGAFSANSVFKSSFKDGLKNLITGASNWGIDQAEEVSSEVLDQLIGNITDRYVLKKKNVNLFDGVKDTSISTLWTSGLVMRAPVIGKSIIAPFRSRQSLQIIGENANRIKELQAELENSPNIDIEAFNSINSEINSLTEKSMKALKVDLDRIDQLTSDEKNFLLKNKADQYNIIRSIESINNNTSISEKAKQIQIKSKQVELRNLEQQRAQIIAPYIIAENKAKNEAILQKSIEKVEQVTKKVLGEGINVVDDMNNLPEGIPKFVDAYVDPKTNQIYINKEWAASVGAVTAAEHELLHKIQKSLFDSNPQKALEIVEDFKNTLGKKELRLIEERLDANYRFKMDDEGNFILDENGNKQKKEEIEYAEEYFNIFSDLVGNKEIGFTDNLGENLLRFVNKLKELVYKPAGFTNLEYQSGRDAYNFIKDYNKSIKKGKVSERAEALIKKGALTTSDRTTPSITTRGQEFIDLSNEGVYNNESLVEIINSPSSNQTDRFAAMEAIVETNWPVISKGLKFNPTGSIPMDAVKTAVTEQMQGIFPGRNKELLADFNPETAQVNTYLGSLMGQRQAEILERAKQIGGVTQEGTSIDSEAAKQVIDTTTRETPTRRAKTPKTPTETVKYSDTIIEKAGVKDKAELETKITEATTESFKDVEVERFGQTKDVPRAVAEIYGGMLGLNPETITNKDRTYQNYDEEGLNAAQRFLLANAASDYARLPKTKDETTTRGRGTFIPKNMKDALYTDGELTGTLKDYMDLLRSKPTGPLYRDSKYAQLIRGLLNTHIRNRMFETLVPTTPQRLRGGAKFSITAKNIFQATYGRSQEVGVNAFEFDWNKQLNELLKDFNVEPFDMNTPEGIDRFLTFVQTPNSQGVTPISKIPASVFIGLGFVSETALTDETIEDLKKENALMKPIFTADGKLGELREVTGNLPFKNSTEAKKWVDSVGKDKFAKESPAFKNMMKKENVFSEKGNLANQLNNKKFQKRQKDSINELKKFFEILQNDIMRDGKDLNPEGVAFVGALLSSISTGTGHFIRKAAPMTFYQKGYFKAGSAKTTLEHTMPASLVGKYLFMQALDGKVSENFKFIKDNYFQGALLKVDDNKLKAKTKTKGKLDFNYIASMPLGWKVTDNVWARYFNSNVAKNDGGINPNSIVLKNNQTIFDKFNIMSSGLIINNKTKKNMPKTVALNNATGPVLLETKPSVTSTQQQVYDKSILDKALNEARKLDTTVKKFEVKQETLNKLGLSTPQQIAIYVAEQAAKGFNDFTFDKASLGKSRAVKEILSQVDIKSKAQQAKFSKTSTFNTVINDMIESSSGIESYKKFSAAKARTIGRDKGRFDFMTLASSAEDFKGLLYRLLGDGKKGEAQFEFLKNNLIDPYNRAEDSIIQAKISAANDFMALKEQFPGLPKTLETETGVGKFTYQHALRTYMWTKQGMSIPGLSKADARKLNKFITDDAKLQAFADQLISIQKGKPYPKPGKDWLGGNLTTDIIGGINKVNRAEYQQEWRENVDIIFSQENLNKMEAAYGTRWRKALENSLARMKAGTNRLGYTDSSNAVLDWVNNSVGAVMFLNTRSALLQTISAVNFLNWGDNNIIKAGKAFANQKQYWSDFMTLMNSDFLVQRRNGLKINVSESEIADAVKDSQNKPKAAIAYLLSKGFVFTRYADSFAIASGGATFYRNRIKKYLKEGMSQELAQEKAFNDFKDVAEESQQSSDPSKISMQQASGAGRVILNWANTPMQYLRIQKRDLQDLIAGRGDPKVKIARIAYYGVVQNLIFNALQQALFAIGFGDDDEDDEKKNKAKDKKIARVANGMIDSQLKGLGIAGMVMLSAKNTLMKIYEESQKKRPEYEAAAIEALSFSPAISSKYRKFVGGLKSFSWNMKEIKEKGFSLDNPAYLAGAQIITAFTNIPIDRVMKKANNIRGILSEQSQMWQKIAMALGYSSYDVGLPYYGGWDKPVEPTPEELKKQEIQIMKRDTNTAEQTQMLLDLGLTKKEIKALRYEDARVKKIIELQNKKKDGKDKP